MNDPLLRKQLEVRGIVQGVGFRPFAYTLATRIGLTGHVRNDSAGVTLEIQGTETALRDFQVQLELGPPPLAHIDQIIVTPLPVRLERTFVILESHTNLSVSTPVSPDIATCDDCLRELRDPADRRYHYPFINCTNCGPRFTILRDIPYDRPLTTMAQFIMCPACQSEYDNPRDRRFHAQPNACPECGPQVWWVAGDSRFDDAAFLRPVGSSPRRAAALAAARQYLADGRVVAIKGLGGFHLACDATSDTAVQRLRDRKGRVDKPFALMVRDLEAARDIAHLTDSEAECLTSRQRPIVLLRRLGTRRGDPAATPVVDQAARISSWVAPGNASLGIMLPYTPLHHLIVGEVPLVMTSGNRSEEPIVRDNLQAHYELDELADAFLLHDRPIHVVCDDAVVCVLDGRELPFRRSRGYAPMPIRLPNAGPCLLAVGGELKATFCLTKGDYAYLSQHIGDMGNLETLTAFERSVNHFLALFRAKLERVVCDLHPDYLSSQWAAEFAQQKGLVSQSVQHHHAHIASVMAEHRIDGTQQVIGVSFDGTGFGTDGAIWGGEFFTASYASFTRIAHLKYLPLPGGDAAIRRPYRTALANLWAAGIPWEDRLPCVVACPPAERRVLRQQLAGNLHCPLTSSMGRLFDAVAAIAGVRQRVSYEAQAAIEMEALCTGPPVNLQHTPAPEGRYRFAIIPGNPTTIDQGPLLERVVADRLAGIPASSISLRFHQAVAAMTGEVCQQVRQATGLDRVALSGGVFQNVLLLRLTRDLLQESGFDVLTHEKVPPNDGGLALGQAAIAASPAW